jgi:hypothetical protein
LPAGGNYFANFGAFALLGDFGLAAVRGFTLSVLAIGWVSRYR